MTHYNTKIRAVSIWFSIFFVLFYVYIYIFAAPYTGLSLQPDRDGWRVQYIERCQEPCVIQSGDIITRIGNISFLDTLKDRRNEMFGGYKPGDNLSLDVLRDAISQNIQFEMPLPPANLTLHRGIIIPFVVPFLLWVLLAEYKLPKSRGQSLLVAGFLSYAAFIATGLLSPSLSAYSSLAVHAIMWLNLAIMVELHWELPIPMGNQFPHRSLFYTAIVMMVLLEMLQILPWRAYYLAVFLQVFVCTALLLWRLAQGVSYRPSLIMLIGMWLAWLPGLFWMGSTSQNHAPDLIYTTFVIILLLVWPFFYLYANYRPLLGKLEGAVRVVVIVTGFGSVTVMFLSIIFVIVGNALAWTPDEIVYYTVMVSSVAALGAVLYSTFFKWIDGRFYGRLDNELSQINESLYSRLTVLGDKDRIMSFLVHEVAEKIGVEQMALYYTDEKEVTLYFRYGCSLPRHPIESIAFSSIATYLQPGLATGVFSWVRVSLPMIAENEIKGYWLLGARKDDSYYAPHHIRTLQYITNGLVAVMEINRQRASLKAQVDTIIEQERMAALGRLSANIAHQINNPLQIIIGALDAHSDYAEPGPSDRNLKLIYDKTVYLSDVVRSITQFVHPGSALFTDVDVNECVESMLPLVHEKLRNNNVSVNLRLSAWLPLVHAAKSDIPQVLTNIIENACDSMSHGGELGIETSVDYDHELVIIRISDTGVGISKGQMLRLFEPFYTTKPEGTGFGLAIAYSIIERNNGRLAVESEIGQGSTFIIKLPAVTERENSYGDYFDRRRRVRNR